MRTLSTGSVGIHGSDERSAEIALGKSRDAGGMRVVKRRAVAIAHEDHVAGTGCQHERKFFSGHDRWRIRDHLTEVDDLTGIIRRKVIAVRVVHGDL
jgi:hypothetical protein